jgi:hypothetical protein
MRSEWIKARTDLHEDPIVFKQATALNRSPHEVAYRWLMVWAWARKHTSNGFVPDTDATVIDAAAGLPGFASHAGRWLKFTRKGVEFPRWDRHNSNGARERAQEQERQNLSRSRHDSVTVKRDKSVTRVEQSRAEQKRSREDKAEPSHASDSSASRSCPALPGQHYTVEYARQCLIGVGISSLEAEAVVSDALVKYPDDGLARIVKGCTRLVGRLRKGKPVENKVNYVQVAGELKKSAKQQVADAKANVAAQVRLVKGQGAA